MVTLSHLLCGEKLLSLRGSRLTALSPTWNLPWSLRPRGGPARCTEDEERLCCGALLLDLIQVALSSAHHQINKKHTYRFIWAKEAENNVEFNICSII